MPIQVKIAATALILSCISTLTAVYFDGQDDPLLSFANPGILVTNIIWIAIIIWLIYDLVIKKSNINLILNVVLVIMAVFIIWDYIDYGISTSLFFYMTEIVFFVTAIVLLRTKELKNWYVE